MGGAACHPGLATGDKYANCWVGCMLPLTKFGRQSQVRDAEDFLMKSMRQKWAGITQKNQIDVSEFWDVTATWLSRPESEGGDIPLIVHIPKGGQSDMPAIIHAHGGFGVFGNEKDPFGYVCYKAVMQKMREADRDATPFCWVSIGYRKAPENSFPKPVEDLVYLYSAMMESSRAQEWGYSPGRVGFLGVSSGGLFCSHACVQAARRVKMPEFCATICPMIDPVMDKPSYFEFADMPICPRSWLVKCWRVLLEEEPGKLPSEERVQEISLLHLDWARCEQMRSLNVTASCEIFRDDGLQLNEVQSAAGVDLTPVSANGSHVVCLTFDKAADAQVRAWIIESLQKKQLDTIEVVQGTVRRMSETMFGILS